MASEGADRNARWLLLAAVPALVLLVLGAVPWLRSSRPRRQRAMEPSTPPRKPGAPSGGRSSAVPPEGKAAQENGGDAAGSPRKEPATASEEPSEPAAGKAAEDAEGIRGSVAVPHGRARTRVIRIHRILSSDVPADEKAAALLKQELVYDRGHAKALVAGCVGNLSLADRVNELLNQPPEE
jgi:hypothetical protein